MLKQIQFVGFEHEQRTRELFERLLPDMACEIGRWARKVAVTVELLKPQGRLPQVGITLTIALARIEASETTVVPLVDAEQPEELRRSIRRVWGHLLASLSHQMAERWDREEEQELAEVHGV